MQIILFGAGTIGGEALLYFGVKNVFCFCDNRIKEEEEELYEKRVISFQKLVEIHKEYVIVISAGKNNNYNIEMGRQLEEAGIEEYLDYSLLKTMVNDGSELLELVQNDIGRNRFFIKYYKRLAESERQKLEYLKRHTDITALKPATGALRERQLYILDFAKEISALADTLGAKLFLNFGNLIGAVRHKGFVPWDDDMDFGIMRGDWEKLLTYAKENCVVGTRCSCDGFWMDLSGEKFYWREIFDRYPDRLIFNIASNMIQVYKGKSYEDVVGFDIFIYDFYKNEYDISEYKKWLEIISGRLYEIGDEKEQVDYIFKEWKNNSMISQEETENIFPGIDNLNGEPGRKFIEEWIPRKNLLPLRKVKFENTEFWAPNDMEGFLKFEYEDFMEFPNDMGISYHIGVWAE